MKSPCEKCRNRECLKTGKPCARLEAYLPGMKWEILKNVLTGNPRPVKQLRGEPSAL